MPYITRWESFQNRNPPIISADEVEFYPAGAQRNVNTFYELITKSQCANETVQRAVDGTLTAILGREAATRRTKMTMDELIKENRKLELDTKDLKV